MTPWSDVFLGVIAVATLAIAVTQVVVIVVAGRLSRRVDELAHQVEHDLKPFFVHLNAIGRDAARAAALATAQVERADRLFADLIVRIERTLDSVQSTLGGPARQSRAIAAAFRAAFHAIRDLRQNARARQGRGDDEDALFI